MEQSPLRSFLQDPVYREWFRQSPSLLPAQRVGKPWWVYVQEEEGGKWKRAGADTYKQAFKFVQKHLKTAYDLSITSKRRAYLPPVYRPVRNGRTAKHREYWSEFPLSHHWCPYCRRPTVFDYFERHHADKVRRTFGKPSPMPRCTICGITTTAVQPWMNLGRN